MNNRTEIRDADDTVLAYKIAGEWPEGLCPYSDDGDFVQVLSWNYDAGRRLRPHAHLPAPRDATHTQEVIVVLSGRLRADVFDRSRRLVARTMLSPGESMVFLCGGHGYEVMEAGTRVLEVKNGPYPGPEADRVRLDA